MFAEAVWSILDLLRVTADLVCFVFFPIGFMRASRRSFVEHCGICNEIVETREFFLSVHRVVLDF